MPSVRLGKNCYGRADVESPGGVRGVSAGLEAIAREFYSLRPSKGTICRTIRIRASVCFYWVGGGGLLSFLRFSKGSLPSTNPN